MNELAFLTGRVQKPRNPSSGGFPTSLMALKSGINPVGPTPSIKLPACLPGTLIFIPTNASKGIQDKAWIVPLTLGTNALVYRHARTLQLLTENQNVLKSDFKSIKLSNHISKHLQRREFKSSEKLSNIYLVANTTTPTQSMLTLLSKATRH